MDSLVTESFSTEVGSLLLIDSCYILIFTNVIYYYDIDRTEKGRNNLLHLWMVFMCLNIGES